MSDRHARRVRVATAVITACRQPGRFLRAVGLSNPKGPAVSQDTIRILAGLIETQAAEVRDLREQLVRADGEIARIQAELDQVTSGRRDARLFPGGRP